MNSRNLIIFALINNCFVVQSQKIPIVEDENNSENRLMNSINNNKYLRPILVDGNNIRNVENSIFKPTEISHGQIFRDSIKNIKLKSKKTDLIILIDSSSSVGKLNFYSEIRFVNKLLKHFDLSYNYTRIALITFSSQGKVIRHIDQISDPSDDQDQCSAITNEIPKLKFVGGGTFTYGALKAAKEIFSRARNNSKKYIFLISDGFSNGRNPIEMAEELKSEKNVTIFTIGIQSGNSNELLNISSSPKEKHGFLLGSFLQFERLVRNALRKDHKSHYKIQLKNTKRCNVLCEQMDTFRNMSTNCCNIRASCECGIPSGFYSCTCPKGYIGSGLLDDCRPCITNSYWVSSDLCRPCPDINHVTVEYPATMIEHCVCKQGFKRTADNRCIGITCPILPPPENGYFVKQVKTCANVLNAACGARCKTGYQLKGTSLRLCQENGTWSGMDALCILKICPSLAVPYFGSIICRNRDLDLLSFDFSPRNQTFMRTYDDESKRITEKMPIDTECSYSCGIGYYLVGSKTRNCLPLSKWDGLQTTCKQIMCSQLPKPTYGFYDLNECTETKVPYDTNCSLLCPPGFNLNGPSVKTCFGKKNGVWSQRNKIPKCVDNIPPDIKCPESFTLNVGPTYDSILIKAFPPPQHVSDSSGYNVSFWLTPTIDEVAGTHLKIKEHQFTYVATDIFNNKAECQFKVSVVDTVPPVIENCIDPNEFIVTEPGGFIEWDEPTFYDNSNGHITVTRSLDPGFLTPAKYQVLYEATDPSGNMNNCVLNITVKELTCGKLESPMNGKSLCAKNLTHTWCEINCNIGYTFYHQEKDNHFESLRLTCLNAIPKWELDPLPDCTIMELPNSIEQMLTISIDTDEPFCSNVNKQNELNNNLKSYICENAEECDVVSEIPDCSEEENQLSNDIISNDRVFYRLSKRDVSKRSIPVRRNTSKLRIRLYTRVGKKLGTWKKNQTLSENIRQIKYQFEDLRANESLTSVLAAMNIDIKKLKIEELIRCPDGSISRKYLCYQCPRGAYQDAAFNRCMSCPIGSYNSESGQPVCKNCPVNYSTRKIGRIMPAECKQLCPPGTAAKVRIPRRQNPQGFANPRSLMPFCRKCNPGDYQPMYDQTECLHCPIGYESYRGARSLSDCMPEELHPCHKNSTICGQFGYCIPENGGSDLYSCICMNGFIGSHCEHQINLCLSGPCSNNGQCYYVNSTSISCHCPEQFRGEFCEDLKYSCNENLCENGGQCQETDDDIICECLAGFDGKYCEHKLRLNYCNYSPCESGKCINFADGYACQCPPGVIGKRCHLKPCDHFPCHENAICVDLLHYPATRESYMCKCPRGLKGYDCGQVHNPCDVQPCKNNGKCAAKALRQIGKFTDPIDTTGLDDKKYGQYICQCQPFFYGDNCEIFITPDFIMRFTKNANTMNYVEMKGPENNLSQISMCVWIRTNDSFNYGSVISYATDDNDNVFTLTDYTGFVLYINGKYIVTDIVANDGEWHFICVAWTSNRGFYEIYMDGELQSTGFNLSDGQEIPSKGIFIIGQEQDTKGGGFSETESFIGNIAYMDIWSEFITGRQIQEYYMSCEPYRGNLYSWTDFKNHIYGNVNVLASSFCQKCPTNLTLSNGHIRYQNNQAIYMCNLGYTLKGNNSIRNCLRTSEWSMNIPYCSIVECSILNRLENGNIEYTSGQIYRSYAEYNCAPGFTLNGISRRICLASGKWSGIESICISKIKCKPIQAGNVNVRIVYVDDSGFANYNEYAVGTFAEISCGSQTSVVDALLTCSDNGNWDGFIPDKCHISTKLMSSSSLNNLYGYLGITTKTTSSPRITTTTTQRSTIKTTLTTRSTPRPRTTTTPTTTTKPTTTTRTTPRTTIRTTSRTTTRTTPKITTTTTTTTTPKTTIRTTPKTTTTTTTPKTTTTTTTKTTPKRTTPKTTKRTTPKTTKRTTPKTTTTSEKPTASYQTTISSISNAYPDKTFWINLKDFLFFGCNSKALIFLCKYHFVPSISDLTDFQPPDSQEFHGIDVKLLSLIEKNTNSISQKQTIHYENFFNMLLYGIEIPHDTTKMSKILEDSLRFCICIYIDIIIWDSNTKEPIQDESSADTITDKLKWLLMENAIPVFRDYRIRIPGCQLTSVYKIPENGYLSESIHSNLNTKEHFETDDKLYFVCNDGYRVHGNREIICKSTGQWTTILARCAKMF